MVPIIRSFLCRASIAGCVVVASACSSSSSGSGQGSDGGSGGGNDSGGTIPDVYQGSPDTGGGSSDAGNSGSTCPTPADLTGWTPPAYHAATGKYQGLCTQAQLTGFYNNCLGSSSSSTACGSNWQQSSAPAANKACANCLATDPSTATKWGPLLLYPVESMNIAGCVELLSGDTSCATTIQQLQDCEHQACDTTCPLTADPNSFTLWQMCITTADGAACKTYSDAANTCAAALVDGGASVCLQNYSAFSDYYNAIAPVFCGSPGGTGGTADDASTD